MRWLLSFALLAACGGKSTTPAPPGTGSDTSDTTAATKCDGAAPGPDYQCIEDCGPPVSRGDEPPPAWHWASPADVKNRADHGCPICLSPDTPIATPRGDVAVSDLTVGAPIYTLDANGRRIEAVVVHVGSTPAPRAHQLVQVTLADGRVVAASAGHPDRQGRALGSLAPGDLLDGSIVTAVSRVPFAADATWDVLPSGSTGVYIANGVVLRSTFTQ